MRFNRSDWQTIISVLAGLVVSAFFWWVTDKNRELVMTTHAVRSQVAGKSVSSDIKVTFRGVELLGDVFSLTIAIWNRGSEPIRFTEDVLSDVIVAVSANTNLVDASIQTTSRKEAKFEIDKTDLAKGRLRLTWKILEKGDGAVIQLLCTGRADSDPTITGTIVGQGRLGPDALLSNASVRRLKDQKLNESFPFTVIFIFVFSAPFALIGWALISGMRHIEEKPHVRFRTMLLMTIVFCMAVSGFAYWLLHASTSPFGF